MQPQLIDSHAHLFSSPLGEEIEAVLARAQTAGIAKIINICIDKKQIDQGIAIRKRYPWIYNAGAVHPHDVEKDGEALFPYVRETTKRGDFVAIGETGLDYHYEFASHEVQQKYLKLHIELALTCNLPLIIHCREAFSDLFEILDAHYRKGSGIGPGVLHCFTGTLKEAEDVLKRDWYLSLSGIATFKKSVELREVARMVPLDRILIETDAPFLAPQSHRGKPNEPAFLVETATVIAAVKGISLRELAEATSGNVKRFLHIQ